jgi:hypothetical protein
MILKEYEQKLLEKAHVLIESQDQRFICLAIMAAHFLLTRQSDENFWVKEAISDALRAKIQSCLEGHNTFDAYIYAKYGIRTQEEGVEDAWDRIKTSAEEIVYMDFEKFYTMVRMARLAWLERILEQGVLE